MCNSRHFRRGTSSTPSGPDPDARARGADGKQVNRYDLDNGHSMVGGKEPLLCMFAWSILN